MTDPLTTAASAHARVKQARATLDDAAAARDVAVRAAQDAGFSLSAIAAALGVSRGRVQHMIYPPEKKPRRKKAELRRWDGSKWTAVVGMDHLSKDAPAYNPAEKPMLGDLRKFAT